MQRWVLEAENLAVGCAEKAEKLHNEGGERGSLHFLVTLKDKNSSMLNTGRICKQKKRATDHGGDAFLHARRHQHRVCHFERDHGDFEATFKNDLGSFGINLNVELGNWSCVPHTHGTAHDHNFFDVVHHVREGLQKDGSICKTPSTNKSNRLGRRRDGPMDEQGAVFGYWFEWNCGESRAIKPSVAMNLRTVGFPFDEKRLSCTSTNRDVVQPRNVAHFQSIRCCFLEGLISENSGDSQQLDSSRMPSKNDCECIICDE
mmetsp:Transcript_58363/g.137533  ORF Transcript_58363/g.137533 Transcript_58363/m.137533 type:complete len:260 (+) Transcript_58363:276-1055(+)